MKKIIGYIIIGVLVIGYIVFSIYISKINPGGNSYLMIGNDVKWEYGKNWTNLLDKNMNIVDLSNSKVYNIGSEKFNGTYDVFYRNKLYLKDSNDDVVLDNNYIVYKGNKKFEVVDYDISNFSEGDYNILSNALNDLGVDGYNNLNLKKKVVLDLDSDGIDETIYSVSNMFSEANEKNYFSLIFVYDNQNIDYLFKDVSYDGKILNRKENRIFSIFDFYSDGKYEIVVNTSGFSLSTTNIYTMFELNNNKYIKVITSD